MKKIHTLIILIVVFISSLGYMIIVYGGCAECVTEIVPMPGSLPSVNGRRGISVRIGPNFNLSNGVTNPIIWNAVFGCNGCSVPSATQQWNNTTDNGVNIGYFLQQNQTTTSPDILIVKVPAGSISNGGADAATGQLKGPDGKPIPGKRIIIVDERALSYPPDRLAALIAHEIGHTLGLGDNYKYNCTTIVNVVTAQKHPLVQASDVAMVNQHLGNRFSCTSAQHMPLTNNGGNPSPTPTPPSTCPDGDFDAICDPQDCNDSDPWASFDMDGDGFCEDVDCNDADPMVYPGAQLDSETSGGEDRNCNGQDDYDEQGLGPCGWLAEQQCRAGGKDWDASHCMCTFYSDPSPILIEERNGFLALAQFDLSAYGGNGDGIISRQDAIFKSLRLWQDMNHNGISEPLEVFPIDLVGLRKIYLEYQRSDQIDQYGNEFRYRAKVKDVHDAQLGRWAWDVFLVNHP
jgi:hypothetical protein